MFQFQSTSIFKKLISFFTFHNEIENLNWITIFIFKKNSRNKLTVAVSSSLNWMEFIKLFFFVFSKQKKNKENLTKTNFFWIVTNFRLKLLVKQNKKNVMLKFSTLEAGFSFSSHSGRESKWEWCWYHNGSSIYTQLRGSFKLRPSGQ